MAVQGRRRQLVDQVTGEVIPTAPYAFLGDHAQVDKRRVEAITESGAFTAAEKYLVLWWIGASPPGMEPLRETGADIGRRVGMTADAVGRINRKLAKARIIVRVGRIGNVALYRISPYIAYHGTGLEQRNAITAFNPPEIPTDNAKKKDARTKKTGTSPKTQEGAA